jgi:hypothetical protein
VQFDIDARHPTEVGDEAKVCLDIIAADLKRSPGTTLALIGNSGDGNAGRQVLGTSAADAAAACAQQQGLPGEAEGH